MSLLSPWFPKPITVPASNETKVVNAIQLWMVRWTSRNGPFSGSTQLEAEAFPTEAHAFKAALVAAFKLVKHTGGETEVTVEKTR